MKFRSVKKPFFFKLLTAAVFLFLGIASAYGGHFLLYETKPEKEPFTRINTKAVPQDELPFTGTVSDATVSEAAASSADASEEKTETASVQEEKKWEPNALTFNLSHAFPDNADSSDPLQSYGGLAFRHLYEKDTDWYADIFNATDTKPADMAEKLGHDRSSVMGKYNILDSAQSPSDPESWTVNKWSNINVDMKDGNGKSVDASSNAKQILAMASVYGYYHDWTDYKDFISYIDTLWQSTRSSDISMGSVYYDDGCITEEKKNAAIAKGNGQTSAAASLPASEEESASGKSSEKATGSDAGEIYAAEETWYDSSSSTVKKNRLAAKKDSTAAESSAAASGEESSTGSTEEKAESGSAQTENAQDRTTENAQNKTTETGTTKTGITGTDYPVCPGHIDLTIHATVYGMEGKNSLFTKDRKGNDKKNFNDRWQGWTEDKMQEALTLAGSDWYRDYGLSISSFSKRTPLSNDEIYQVLSSLPADLSTPRRKLIACALHSVGNIPYYYGGKPSGPGYDGNHFYQVVSPDYKGRIFRGLDCSGWVSWVYWTALGGKLSDESTSGLVNMGKSIRREELQPGDIIVRAGSEETIGHVIMFLGWNSDGTIHCIHETGGRINNATIADRDVNWNYRNLVD